jgi:hypothetical protein
MHLNESVLMQRLLYARSRCAKVKLSHDLEALCASAARVCLSAEQFFIAQLRKLDASPAQKLRHAFLDVQ